MQNSPPSSSTTTTTTTVYTILTITTLLFPLFFFSSFPTTPPPPSFSDPYLFPHRPSTAQYYDQLLFTTTNKTTNQSPPSIAFFIFGSSNDSGWIIRLLFSIYHPRNQYLLHLDSSAPKKERDFLALTVQSVKVMWSAQNVNVIGKSDLVYPKGSSSVSSTLHGAAILLKLCSDWDWFINLSAADGEERRRRSEKVRINDGGNMYHGAFTATQHLQTEEMTKDGLTLGSNSQTNERLTEGLKVL